MNKFLAALLIFLIGIGVGWSWHPVLTLRVQTIAVPDQEDDYPDEQFVPTFFRS